jgi:hypothetical protein
LAYLAIHWDKNLSVLRKIWYIRQQFRKYLCFPFKVSSLPMAIYLLEYFFPATPTDFWYGAIFTNFLRDNLQNFAWQCPFHFKVFFHNVWGWRRKRDAAWGFYKSRKIISYFVFWRSDGLLLAWMLKCLNFEEVSRIASPRGIPSPFLLTIYTTSLLRWSKGHPLIHSCSWW